MLPLIDCSGLPVAPQQHAVIRPPGKEDPTITTRDIHRDYEQYQGWVLPLLIPIITNNNWITMLAYVKIPSYNYI